MAASIALCVGHSRSRPDGAPEGGAVSVAGVSEWEFNKTLAIKIAAILREQYSLDAIIVDDYEGSSYGKAMRWLAGHLKQLGGIRLAVELHFNSSDNPAATGHEWLYWSGHGQIMAEHLRREVYLSMPQLTSRGTKPINSGRGAEFLRLTHCPAVICEPFFGSNPRDWEIASTQQDRLARAMASALATTHRQSPAWTP